MPFKVIFEGGDTRINEYPNIGDLNEWESSRCFDTYNEAKEVAIRLLREEIEEMQHVLDYFEMQNSD